MTADPRSDPRARGTLDWSAEGAPRSRLFGDVYFSAADGLGESRAVFLQGCGLPEAWRGRARFTVAELGFGTGLNILALLDLWRRERDPGARLHAFSVEAFPLSREEAGRALAAWPELSDLAEVLLAAWPRAAAGFHRIDLPQFGAVLDLAVGEAAWALDRWRGRADAWFLDGFSPAVNPQMWRPEVLSLVAERSAPGARLGTFTVAGAVRRGLADQGFHVEKVPGFGRKRERLQARLPGAPGPERPPPRAAVIGGGIAGAALCRAFAALGARPLLIEAEAPGAGASGNPAALVAAAFDASGGPRAAFFAQALARAADLYAATPGATIAVGALQVEAQARDAGRFDAVAESPFFAEDALARLSPEETARRLGEAAAPGALFVREALVAAPADVLAAWTAGAERLTARVVAAEPAASGLRLTDAEGGLIAEVDAAVFACGAEDPLGLGLQPVRGQASWADGVEAGPAAAWGGYCIPTRGGVLFGATHDRGRADAGVDPADDGRNLALLAKVRPALAGRLDGAALFARASVRAASADRAPLAGALPDRPGVFVLAGLGSRGFTTAPLLAEHVVASVLRAPSPLPDDLAGWVRPGRPSARRKGDAP